MRLLFAASLVCAWTLGLAAQDTGLLRITVVVTDADGNAVPVPRAQLLISDNPSTREPRRVRTGSDGSVEVTLPAGNYTVESDVPVSLGTRHFTWTQTLDVPAGRETELQLTIDNADVETTAEAAAVPAAATRADGAVILATWQSSLAEIWTPLRHATGFVVDRRGLIATSDRALGEADEVEVEFNDGHGRIKVAGRVVASERTRGVALIRVNPSVVAAREPVSPACGAAQAIGHDDSVVALIAPILEAKTAVSGTAIRPDAQSFRVDWRLDEGSAGGPVFDFEGTPVGIAVGDDEAQARERRPDSYVIPIANVCDVIASAEPKIASAAPPSPASLRTEAGLPPAPVATMGNRNQQTPRTQPPVIRADDYDVALMTPAMINGAQGNGSPRLFFGRWSAYVANAPQVLFVRVSPQFEESFWRLLARGAASTQGVMLPPMPSFSSTFGRMRAYCGQTEVTPIHRLTIEAPVDRRGPVREALYVFAPTDFGPSCGSVRFELFSEKSPNKGDSRVIDPALLEKVLSPTGA